MVAALAKIQRTDAKGEVMGLNDLTLDPASAWVELTLCIRDTIVTILVLVDTESGFARHWGRCEDDRVTSDARELTMIQEVALLFVNTDAISLVHLRVVLVSSGVCWSDALDDTEVQKGNAVADDTEAEFVGLLVQFNERCEFVQKHE